MTYAQAVEILESEDFAQQQRSEILAEAGMSAVAGGWSGYDGMSVASQQMADREAAFFASTEGRVYAARLIEAQAIMADAHPLQPHQVARPSTDDIPF